jgi:hypothetical protein
LAVVPPDKILYPFDFLKLSKNFESSLGFLGGPINKSVYTFSLNVIAQKFV